ncbi:hypothetical protein Dimus_029415, partial [Dionaea muscipula]
VGGGRRWWWNGAQSSLATPTSTPSNLAARRADLEAARADHNSGSEHWRGNLVGVVRAHVLRSAATSSLFGGRRVRCRSPTRLRRGGLWIGSARFASGGLGVEELVAGLGGDGGLAAVAAVVADRFCCCCREHGEDDGREVVA